MWLKLITIAFLFEIDFSFNDVSLKSGRLRPWSDKMMFLTAAKRFVLLTKSFSNEVIWLSMIYLFFMIYYTLRSFLIPQNYQRIFIMRSTSYFIIVSHIFCTLQFFMNFYFPFHILLHLCYGSDFIAQSLERKIKLCK